MLLELLELHFKVLIGEASAQLYRAEALYPTDYVHRLTLHVDSYSSVSGL